MICLHLFFSLLIVCLCAFPGRPGQCSGAAPEQSQSASSLPSYVAVSQRADGALVSFQHFRGGCGVYWWFAGPFHQPEKFILGTSAVSQSLSLVLWYGGDVSGECNLITSWGRPWAVAYCFGRHFSISRDIETVRQQSHRRGDEPVPAALWTSSVFSHLSLWNTVVHSQ